MKIRYLKDSPQGQTGDIAVVNEIEARVLIAIGHAKFVEHDENNHFPTSNDVPSDVLLNKNGTPVIDDFGNMVTKSSSATVTEIAPQPKKKRTPKEK